MDAFVLIEVPAGEGELRPLHPDAWPHVGRGQADLLAELAPAGVLGALAGVDPASGQLPPGLLPTIGRIVGSYEQQAAVGIEAEHARCGASQDEGHGWRQYRAWGGG